MNTTVQTRRLLLAHSTWDIIPVLAGLAHLVYVVGIFLVFDRLPWWGVILAGLGYAYLIACNINSVSHNFIHNPYFVSPALNRAYSLLLRRRSGMPSAGQGKPSFVLATHTAAIPICRPPGASAITAGSPTGCGRTTAITPGIIFPARPYGAK